MKNYYIILGVPRTESERGIRSAYRDLAKRFHPDVVGEGGTAQFQQIVEAYDVLSDSRRRREHNRQLDETARASSPLVQAPPTVTGQPEPLIPEPSAPFPFETRFRPSFESLHQRVVRNFTGVGVPKAERSQGLNVEVVLEPDEARRGGVVPVGVPAYVLCAACRGSGRDWFHHCLDCDGQGVIVSQTLLGVRFPPGIRSGTVIETSLRRFGVQNLYLRLHFLVE